LKHSVMALSSSESSLLAIDNSASLYWIDMESGEFLRSVELLGEAKQITHPFGRGFDFFANVELFLPLTTLGKGVSVALEPELAKRHVVSWHDDQIEVARYSPDGRFLATGGADGRVYVFDRVRMIPVASPPKSPDAINALTFGVHKRVVASASYPGRTVVFDLKRNIELMAIETKEVVEALAFFDHDRHLVGVCRDGTVFVANLLSRQLLSKHKLINGWPTVVIVDKTGRHLLVGTREEKLHLLRIPDNKLILTIPMEEKGMTTFLLKEGELVIGFKNGTIHVYAIDEGFEDFALELKLGNYATAKKILNANPFLQLTEEARGFDLSWPSVRKEAMELIARGESVAGLKKAEPFLDHPERAADIKNILSRRDLFRKVLTLIREKKFVDALKLAEDEPLLKEFKFYESLDLFWRRHFEAAKKIMIQEGEAGQKKAEAILKPFLSIKQRKSQIYAVLYNPAVFADADRFVARRDFAGYFALTATYPFLCKTDIYRRVEAIGLRLLATVSEQLAKGELEQASQTLDTVSGFLPLKAQIDELKEQLELHRRLEMLYAKEAFGEIAQLIEKYPILTDSLFYQRIEEKFEEAMSLAYEMAVKGAAAKAFAHLSPFLPVVYYHNKIAETMKTAYLYEMLVMAKVEKNTISGSSVNWSEAFALYISRFGCDSELTSVAKRIGRGDLLDDLESRINADPLGFKRLPLVPSIFKRS
ncbi:MAG: hypothetical protein K6347_05105, partial [Campylobacterales bacterium]